MAMERSKRLSTSSVGFRDTPELSSTPPPGANAFARTNAPTPPSILTGSPRNGTVAEARAMARTTSQELTATAGRASTMDLVNNMKKLRCGSHHRHATIAPRAAAAAAAAALPPAVLGMSARA